MSKEIVNKFIKEGGGDTRVGVPEGIVCLSSYNKYVAYELQFKGLVQKYSRIRTTTPGVYINLSVAKPTWEAYRMYLPEDEYERYCNIRSKMAKIRNNAYRLRRIAFGGQKPGDVKERTAAELALGSRYPEILDLFGRFYTLKEVHEICLSKWGLEIRIHEIERIYRDNREDIMRRRDTYANDFSHVRLGHKRSRLDELAYMFKRRKEKFDIDGYRITDSREMRAILEQIRKEVEGDKITIDGNITVNHEHTVEMHVHNMIMSDVSIKQLIIGRAAARLGIDASVLVERLMTSYYSKYTGYAKPTRSEDTNEKIYPSKVFYDFDEVIATAEDKTILSGDKSKVKEVSKDDSVMAVEMKTRIIKKIIEKKKSVLSSKSLSDTDSSNTDTI